MCFNNIKYDGVYSCTNPLTGCYLGVERTGSADVYALREIWAYTWAPFDETNSVLSADMPNLTLTNSVHLVSSPVINVGLSANTLFITGPAVNCYWKMDLGS